MSSDHFDFDNCFLYQTSSPAQDQLFFETAREIEDSSNFLIELINESSSWEQIASLLVSSPPRISQLESSSPSELRDAVMEVKREEYQLSFSSYGTSFSSGETAAEFMQMTCGHNYYCQNEDFFPFGPQFDRVLESKNSKNQLLGSPESICSNGDLQEKTKVVPPFSSDKPLMEEGNFKVGRYSKEERKWRIDRYRAKRTRRNFNKTIKYACRKTLADGRQRIRGRFVRNDEILQPSLFQRCEDRYDLWNIDDWLISRRRSS